MHELINKLAFSLFKKNSLEECSPEEIENLAKQYPYFSSAQLLLAAKQKAINHQDFENQLLLTSLHVNNPLWLNHLLNTGRTNKEKNFSEEQITASLPPYEDSDNDELVLENHSPEPTVLIKPEGNSATSATPIIERSQQKDPLVFEPYYTVDYFASQGIKNVIEEAPKDRFSQQLKSFTEWLKTIRQMPPQEIAALTETGSEEKIVQLATHSLDERNVETEAMAEVWIKQGQPEKAAEIYRKLSLLNPSKSSYFAVLIEKLKKN
jgi:hypothetical protein